MSYKPNKNLITGFLALFIILNSVENGYTQGVVTLVEEENPSVEADLFPDAAATDDKFGADETKMDTELPDTLSEDEFIPLDDGLISPEESVQAEAKAPQQAAAEQPAKEQLNANPEFDATEDFSLNLVENADSQPTDNAQQQAKEQTNATGENALFAAAEEKAAPVKSEEKFANSVLARIDNDLFSQMSDIEKQTTLLTLELRREKLRNEIEAIKAQREKAIQEKLAAEEEQRRKEIEWQKDQEAKVFREQQLLKEKEIELEKLKQKKMLNGYMNEMLSQKQKWIEENALLHQQMRQVEEDRKRLADDFKAKIEALVTQSNKMLQQAQTARSNHDRSIASLTAQNIQLKKRIEADALAAKNREQNPFGDTAEKGAKSNSGDIATSADAKMKQVNLSKEYAIMDIVGKGDNLAARLINKDGESFMVNKGTMLQTGHMVDEITERYIQFDRHGLKDYLYTSGSAIGVEPQKMEGTATMQAVQKKVSTPKQVERPKNVEKGIPSLATGMFVK